MYNADTILRAEQLKETQVILYDGRYYVVHGTQRWVNRVEIRMNCLDNITPGLHIETIELPRDLFVLTFRIKN